MTLAMKMTQDKSTLPRTSRRPPNESNIYGGESHRFSRGEGLPPPMEDYPLVTQGAKDKALYVWLRSHITSPWRVKVWRHGEQ